MAKIEGNGSCCWWRRRKHKMNSKKIHGVMICLESGRGPEHCSHRIKYLCILSGSLVSESITDISVKTISPSFTLLLNSLCNLAPVLFGSVCIYFRIRLSSVTERQKAQQGAWDMESVCLGSYPGSNAHKRCGWASWLTILSLSFLYKVCLLIVSTTWGCLNN